MAIAKHEPGKVYKRNRSVLSMSEEQLDEYASTPEKGLPQERRQERRERRRQKRRERRALMKG